MTSKRVRNIGFLALILLVTISTSVVAAPYGSRTLFVGRFGGDVLELQQRLTSLGYDTAEDGIFGDSTRQAVLQFQRDYGLVPDGIADKWTFRAVDRAYMWQHGRDHSVVSGDTLWGIARRHGTDVATIVWLNRLQDTMIYPGQILRLPGDDGEGGGVNLAVPEPPVTIADYRSALGTDPHSSRPADPGEPGGPDQQTIPGSETGGAGKGPGSEETTPSDKPDTSTGTGDVPSAGNGRAGQPATVEEPAAKEPVTSPETAGSIVNTIAGAWRKLEDSGWALVKDGTRDKAVRPPAKGVDGSPGEPDALTSSGDPDSAQGLEVLGYYAEDWAGDTRSLRSLQSAAHLVDLVVNFQMQLQADGSIVTREYPQLMAEARSRGLEVQGLVHNYHGGWFDAGVAEAVLSNPAVRARAIANILSIAKHQGLSGINVDIENVPPAQRNNYTALIRELSAALHAEGLTLSISIPAKNRDDPTSSWSGAFDYKALGQYADRVAPMAYDEHAPGYDAGPVASISWYERVAAYAASQIPPEKILMGVPAYGYDWRVGTREGRGLSVPQAMDMALEYGARILWDEEAQVPYFYYMRNGQERVVYYENARSLAAKLDVVKQYNLRGIAIWRLGFEDPSIWSVIASKAE